MLIAIERSQFNYLFKQNSIQVDVNKIYWRDKTDLIAIQEVSLEKAIVELDSILPCFEEDHEVILLEYDHGVWEYNEYKQLEFSGVLSIIPLTKLGRRLLIAKLNPKMRILEPMFEKAVEGAKNKRSLNLRRHAAERLLSLFNLDNPPVTAVKLIEQAIAKLNNEFNKPTASKNIFQTLFAYNTTEGFIPEGNVEHLCKIAVLARLHIGQDPAIVQNGPYYKELLSNTSFLNKRGLVEAFKEFSKLSSVSVASTQKIKEIINENLDFDMFFVTYSFFAFRRMLNKAEFDLDAINVDLKKLQQADSVVASIVMYAIGTVFSFEQLYESIHILSEAPLVTSKKVEIPTSETQPPKNPWSWWRKVLNNDSQAGKQKLESQVNIVNVIEKESGEFIVDQLITSEEVKHDSSEKGANENQSRENESEPIKTSPENTLVVKENSDLPENSQMEEKELQGQGDTVLVGEKVIESSRIKISDVSGEIKLDRTENDANENLSRENENEPIKTSSKNPLPVSENSDLPEYSQLEERELQSQGVTVMVGEKVIESSKINISDVSEEIKLDSSEKDANENLSRENESEPTKTSSENTLAVNENNYLSKNSEHEEQEKQSKLITEINIGEHGIGSDTTKISANSDEKKHDSQEKCDYEILPKENDSKTIQTSSVNPSTLKVNNDFSKISPDIEQSMQSLGSTVLVDDTVVDSPYVGISAGLYVLENVFAVTGVTQTFLKGNKIEPILVNNENTSLQLFKEFVQQKLSKKDQNILSIIGAYESELKNGITFKWLHNKLFPGDSLSNKKSSISDNSLKKIQKYFLVKN